MTLAIDHDLVRSIANHDACTVGADNVAEPFLSSGVGLGKDIQATQLEASFSQVGDGRSDLLMLPKFNRQHERSPSIATSSCRGTTRTCVSTGLPRIR